VTARLLTLLLLALTLSACAEHDDSWNPRAQFRSGDIVIWRIDGATGMVLRARCLPGDECTYVVSHPRWTGPRSRVERFEISKAPQRMCKDSQNANGSLIYQEGDRAAEARCAKT
jgi:hypothetical protein